MNGFIEYCKLGAVAAWHSWQETGDPLWWQTYVYWNDRMLEASTKQRLCEANQKCLCLCPECVGG